ncbi:MAG: tetratricopeptide repeat protein [Microbacterium sp.]|uniref:tetratricopeptide repeat protein n=1 Tax=Microbacterium sp. TaxID=51671 RepID=UPI0039E6E250
MSYIKGWDAKTLREVVDVRACRERLDEIGEQRSLPALLERVWLLKVLGRPEDALVISEESVRVARMGGTRKDLLRARILHASVNQRLGAFEAALHELTTCAAEAEGQGWGSIAAFALQHRGRVHFDAGDYDEARSDFKQALFMRQELGVPDDQLESTILAIDTVDRHRAAVAIA